MWLRVCNAVCQNTKSPFEKWIYATLCGNVQELLTYVSNEQNDGNWFDLLWVLCICKKIYVQHNLLSNELPSFYHNDLKNEALNDGIFKSLHIIDSNWEQTLFDFDAMFHWIEQSEHGLIAKEVVVDDNDCKQQEQSLQPVMDHANKGLFSKLFGFDDANNHDSNNDIDYFDSTYNFQYYKICKFVICEQYEELLQSCWSFIHNKRLKKIKNGITLDFMRFVIHLYLHLNPNIALHRHKNDGSNACAAINQLFMDFLKVYIGQLIEHKHYDMISRYCYILPKAQLMETLTNFLSKLDDISIRIKLITKAKDVLPPEIISKISGNIAASVIDEGIRQSKEQKEWMFIMKEQELLENDLHKIDSLTCLKIVNDNYEEILYRTNQLFTMFVKDYKTEGVRKLYDSVDGIIDYKRRHLDIRPSWQSQTNENKKMQCHLNCYECYQCYKGVIDAYNVWERYHFSQNVNENDKHRNVNEVMDSVKRMLLYKYGWLNPRYCNIQELNFDEIDEIRAVVLERLLRMLYHFIVDAKQYRFCLELTTIFADPKYSYFTLFKGNKQVIKGLLNEAKRAKIEIIKYEQQMQRRQREEQI